MAKKTMKTLQPAVANGPQPAVELIDPKTAQERRRKAEGLCFSAIHDRPHVELNVPPGGTLPARGHELLLAAPISGKGPRGCHIFDTKALPDEYFHPEGTCPCEDGEPVTEDARKKQLVRIARRDEKAWIG